jgi:hypothetical protein
MRSTNGTMKRRPGSTIRSKAESLHQASNQYDLQRPGDDDQEDDPDNDQMTARG